MGEIRLKRGLEKQEGRERHENKVDGLGGAEAGVGGWKTRGLVEIKTGGFGGWGQYYQGSVML